MVQNQFAGGPVVNEVPRTSIDVENKNEPPLNKAKPGAGIFGAFSEDIVPKEVNPRIQEQQESRKDVFSRMEENTGYAKEILEAKLADNDEREKNRIGAKELFYSSERVEEYIKQTIKKDGTDFQLNLDLFESQEWQDDLDKILGNFIVDIDSQDLESCIAKDMKNHSYENFTKIHTALTIAFEIEILNTLNGKVNYPKDEVNDLIVEIRDSKTNPFTKLKLFEKIKKMVNNKEGIGGKKQEGLFQKGVQKKEMVNKTLQERFDDIKFALKEAKIEKNKEKLVGLSNDIKELKVDEKISGEVFVAGELDVIKDEIEKALLEIDPLTFV